MEYNKLIDSVQSLDFIKDESSADAAVKAVFGIMASRMKEEDAKEFTSLLPEPLTFEKLHGHQAQRVNLNPEEYYEELATELNLNRNDAEQLVNRTLEATKRELSDDEIRQWEEKLPEEWASMVEQA